MHKKLSALICAALAVMVMLAGCSAKTETTTAAPQINTESTKAEDMTTAATEAATEANPEPTEAVTEAEETTEATTEEKTTEAEKATEAEKTTEAKAPVATENTTTEAPKPTEAPAAATTQTFRGYVIDKCCFEIPGPEEDTWDCLLMDSCRDSGYGLAIPDSSAPTGYVWYAFDAKGQELAYNVILNSNKWTQISVKVTGTLENNIIHVKTMREG